MSENVSPEREGAFAEPEYVPPMRKIGKEEFVRRMMSDSRKKILEKKKAERQKDRVINDYRGDNITKYMHKMHRRDRGWYK